MANILTSIRIVCGLLILIFPAFSKWFYWLYLIGGFTDAIDGAVARKLGTAAPFGAKFDTLADFAFFLAVVIRLAGAVHFPIWLLLWIGVILAIKLANAVIGFVKYKTFAAVHSAMNRICGVIVYVTPLLIGGKLAWQVKAAVLSFVCLFATASAIAEGIVIIRR